MKIKKFNVIGVMSGTSCDGLDIAHCSYWENNGTWNYKLKNKSFTPYNSIMRDKLLKSSKLSSYDLKKLDNELGELISESVLSFIKQNSIKPSLISSHGHTVLHNPTEKITLQIGNPLIISAKTKMKVISNFRELDVLGGGQGAPLVPYGDKKLFGEYDYCINIGGIVNISNLKSKKLIAYDVCPANIILNKYSRNMGLEYDEDGIIASKGNKSNSLFTRINDISYYTQEGPKSLDINLIEKKFIPILEGYSNEDILCTTTHHIAYQINKSIISKKSNVLLTGGGVFNKFLLKKIRSYNKQDHKFIVPNSDIISFKEAIIFGYLGLLRYLKCKNVVKSVTGSRYSSSSGVIVESKLF